MFKLLATGAVISKGYDGKPPLRFHDTEQGPIVRFRIGKTVFDSRCQDNRRWININAKATGAVCERIRKMKLKEGDCVNVIGCYDEETMKSEGGQKPRKFPLVIVEEIEYCYSGGQKNKADNTQPGNPGTGQDQEQTAEQAQAPPAPLLADPMPDNFSGFETLGGTDNPYF